MDAEFADAQEVIGKVSVASQIAAYVCFSRVKLLSGIYVLQAFSPLLFSRGPPKGPERLIRKLSGRITASEALEEWEHDDEGPPAESAEKANDVMKTKHRCTSCYLRGETVYMHSVQDFGIHHSSQFYPYYMAEGCWTRCMKCAQACSTAALPEKSVGRHVSTSSHSVQVGGTKSSRMCGVCVKSFITCTLAENEHCCSTCEASKKYASVFASSTKNIAPLLCTITGKGDGPGAMVSFLWRSGCSWTSSTLNMHGG